MHSLLVASFTFPSLLYLCFNSHSLILPLGCSFLSTLPFVTIFAKRDHLGANLNFEFCILCKSTRDELPIALYCALLAGSVSEIHSLKMWNYEHSVFKKTAFKHLLPVNPTFCHVTNDGIGKHGRTVYNTRLGSSQVCKAGSSFTARSLTQCASNSCGWHAEVGSWHR